MLLFACLALSHKAHSTHVVGGEITYQYKGNNDYNVRLDLFIDCLNGNAGAIASDATAYFYVFYKNSNALVAGYPVSVPRSQPERLVKLNYNCLGNLPNACVDHYWYETTMNLPPGKGDYIISFQRCCRNGSITNLNNPLNQGANYWTTIPDATTIGNKKENSSAVFKELPPNFLCVNAPLKFDQSATDADGDSLAYDLFFPYIGATPAQPRPDNSGSGAPDYPPFQNITYSGTYNYSVPIDGNPKLSINPLTGELNLVPTKLGQFVVGIRVREYRKGILISETKRDYQFNVLDCKLNVYAGFAAPSKVCDTTVLFTNKSIFASRYHWDFGVSGTSADTSVLENPLYSYPQPGVYKVTLEVQGNNCKDTAMDTVRIGHKFSGSVAANTLPCGGKTTFTITSPAPARQLLVDGKTYSNTKTEIELKAGRYPVYLLLIDTIAGCNDTSGSAVEINDNINDLRLANVFTPDLDGLNDCYRVGGVTSCLSGKIHIFNRWGELVFNSETLDFCWNGKVMNTGSVLPEGVYFYQLFIDRGTGDSGKKVITGSINLIR